LKNELDLTQKELDFILSPEAIRDRAAKIFSLTQEGKTHFSHHDEKLKPTVDYVLSVIRKNYPDLNIPFHSRWGHFRAGGIDRVVDLNKKLKGDTLDVARSKIDLVVTSVLLDAGAGAQWKYKEKSTGQTLSRSEGLGVASLYLFLAGRMSRDQRAPRADSAGLKSLRPQDIEMYFQVSPENPLVGVEGRVKLLNNLGKAVENVKIFKDGRPGNIIDYLLEKNGKAIPAKAILRAVLDGFGSIWPGRIQSNGVNLGDVWNYAPLGKGYEGLVPIHKLSQWMTYSLIEPILETGASVIGIEELTGLAEYRNGGLLLDSGLLSFKNPKDQKGIWQPSSDLIIEWRALTVYLLDVIGKEVQIALDRKPQDFPLAKVLEGGTWWAGRFLAKEKRIDGGPPIQIASDGTVF
jgi:hypothetical protein